MSDMGILFTRLLWNYLKIYIKDMVHQNAILTEIYIYILTRIKCESISDLRELCL